MIRSAFTSAVFYASRLLQFYEIDLDFSQQKIVKIEIKIKTKKFLLWFEKNS